MLAVDAIDHVEVGKAGQKDRRLYDIAKAEARLGQDLAQVFERAARLGLDTAGDQRAGSRIEPNLARAENHPVTIDRLRVRPDSRRSVRRVDLFHGANGSGVKAAAVLIADPRHAHHALDRADRAYQVVKLPRTRDADLEKRKRAAVVAARFHFRGRDVYAGGGDRLRHRGQQAGLIDA